MTWRQTVRLTIGIVLAGVFVWLVARQIDLEQLRNGFAETDLVWILAAIVAFSIGYACRIERWRVMLKPDQSDLEWSQCAGPFLGSFAANNVLPFRAGDVLRAFAFNRRLGVSSGIVVATLVVERLLDLLMVLVFLGIALALFGLKVTVFAGVGSAVLLAVAIGIIVLLLYPRLFAWAALGVGRLCARAVPRLGDRLQDEINNSVSTLFHLANGGTMAKLITWSLAAWLAEGCVFWCAAMAVAPLNAPVAAWLAFPVGTLATLIPSTPGYVGTFDFFTIHAMATMGNSMTAATAYGLLVHALIWIPPTLLGGVYLLFHPVRKPKKVSAL